MLSVLGGLDARAAVPTHLHPTRQAFYLPLSTPFRYSTSQCCSVAISSSHYARKTANADVRNTVQNAASQGVSSSALDVFEICEVTRLDVSAVAKSSPDPDVTDASAFAISFICRGGVELLHSAGRSVVG